MRPVLASLILLLTVLPAGARTLPEPLARLLPPRPVLEDYQDQARFVADVLAWERQRETLQRQLESGELVLEEPEQEPEEPDWHHVTGPEDLETAINNARGYVQPRYPEKYRYNRTTHVSFPLEHLPAEVLAHEVIPAEGRVTVPLQLETLPEQILDQFERVQELTQALPPPAPVKP